MTSDSPNEQAQGGLTPQQRRRRERLRQQQAEPARPDVRVVEIAPVARPARMHLRHWLVLLSFLFLVAAPATVAGVYLYARAADQYASRVAFTVRREEGQSGLEMLGGLMDLSASSSTDTDILYEFIQSQELVGEVDAALDLEAIYRKPEGDPIFTLQENATIEDKVEYWHRMVRVFYDPGTGLIEVEARAFAPEDARAISQRIFELSTEMINDLSAVAASDLTGYAREELDQAAQRLKEARLAVTSFRNRHQIVDPEADIEGQMGLLNSLQAQLAAALIELDMLSSSAQEGDPRLAQSSRRIEVIRSRINEERRKLGVVGSSDDSTAYADLIGQFESLQVDREFAEQSYLSALAAYDTAVAEARRKSRYLAAYERPTLAESAEYPRRATLLAVITLGLFGTWCMAVLIAYSLRDRR